jgi:hypothetical protein
MYKVALYEKMWLLNHQNVDFKKQKEWFEWDITGI